MLLHIPGPRAFSDAALAKKLTRIRAGNPGVAALGAAFVHLLELEAELPAEARALLDRLLSYGPRRPLQRVEGVELVIVPRIGTISPWSSKATEIARSCGLSQVRRIERGAAAREQVDARERRGLAALEQLRGLFQAPEHRLGHAVVQASA